MEHEYNIGETYGCLELIDIFRKEESNCVRLYAKCKCVKCGKEKIIRASDLYCEKTNSCRCNLYTHKMTKTRIYHTYANMKYRCDNPNFCEYYNYGGKGISVCDEWSGEHGFENFYEWAINNGYDNELTIDRIDSNKNYCPENCRWVTKSENTASANKTCQHRRADKGDYYAISPEGDLYLFENANQFAREHNELSASGIRDAANKRKYTKKLYKNWEFGFVSEIKNESLITNLNRLSKG